MSILFTAIDEASGRPDDFQSKLPEGVKLEDWQEWDNEDYWRSKGLLNEDAPANRIAA